MDPRSVSFFTSAAMGTMVLCLCGHHFYVKKKLLILEKYLDYMHLENQTLIASIASLKEAIKDKRT